MKVAVVCPYAVDRPGGVQVQATELVARLGDAGHHAWLVAPPVDGGGVAEVRVNRSVAPVSLAPKAGVQVVRRLAGADVIHIHEPFVPVVSLAALLWGRAPKVGTFHASPGRGIGWAYRLGTPLLRRLSGRLAVATTVSGVAQASVEGFCPTVVIPNALSCASFIAEVERTAHRVAFLGRDDPRKGLDVLLGAWPAVREAVPDAELAVVGASRPRPFPAGVRYLGRVSEEDKRFELSRAALLAAPNLGEESFGLVPAEGMAAGCAVVASALPGFVEVVGEAGVLVPPGDPAALAKALVELLQDGARRRELGERGRRRARRFDWEMVLPRYLEVYEQALRGPLPPSAGLGGWEAPADPR
ncbi:MAG: glycosyltransferase family 4 protein [Actinomycetota bacterium]|nr:glycosyltransferase family 4 protein [Actinomycetota bacterium]